MLTAADWKLGDGATGITTPLLAQTLSSHGVFNSLHHIPLKPKQV